MGFKNSVVKAEAIRLIRDADESDVLISDRYFLGPWENIMATDYSGCRCAVGAMFIPHVIDNNIIIFHSVIIDHYGINEDEQWTIEKLNDAYVRAKSGKTNSLHASALREDLYNYLESL